LLEVGVCHRITEYGLLGPYSWGVYKIWAFRAIFSGKTYKIWAFRAIFRSLKFCKNNINYGTPFKKRKIRKNTSYIHSKSY